MTKCFELLRKFYGGASASTAILPPYLPSFSLPPLKKKEGKKEISQLSYGNVVLGTRLYLPQETEDMNNC